MPKYRCRVDSNQKEIVEVLERTGWSVCDVSAVGGGLTDLIIAKHALNILAEIKDPAVRGTKNEYTKPQQRFHAGWKGSLVTLRTVDDVLALNQCMVSMAETTLKVAKKIAERMA